MSKKILLTKHMSKETILGIAVSNKLEFFSVTRNRHLNSQTYENNHI